MSEIRTEATTLCEECGVPIDTPKPQAYPVPGFVFMPKPLCKHCLVKLQHEWLVEQFRLSSLARCPFQKPKWRPKE